MNIIWIGVALVVIDLVMTIGFGKPLFKPGPWAQENFHVPKDDGLI